MSRTKKQRTGNCLHGKACKMVSMLAPHVFSQSLCLSVQMMVPLGHIYIYSEAVVIQFIHLSTQSFKV